MEVLEVYSDVSCTVDSIGIQMVRASLLIIDVESSMDCNSHRGMYSLLQCIFKAAFPRLSVMSLSPLDLYLGEKRPLDLYNFWESALRGLSLLRNLSQVRQTPDVPPGDKQLRDWSSSKAWVQQKINLKQ